MTIKNTAIAVSIFSILLVGCDNTPAVTKNSELNGKQPVPASQFDLSHWSLTVPFDQNHDGAADIYNVTAIQTYSHPKVFYLDGNNNMVFASPNQAATERTSTNTRSELRYMSRGAKTSISESSPSNNFALSAHKDANNFASIGSKLQARLHVDHVAKNAGYPNKPPAYSVVIGQVHALQLQPEQQTDGVGWGNEPLKISYKKWPNHKNGSVYWTYERNLATNNPDRIDIAYSVWGNNWDDATDPGDEGIALGEEFSYTVNIYKNVMHLVFTSAKHGTVHQQINLADNIDANGKLDHADYALGYTNEILYFKAGAYNQCSTKANNPSFRYPACAGTGDWDTDIANGDYTQVTFSELTVSSATPME